MLLASQQVLAFTHSPLPTFVDVTDTSGIRFTNHSSHTSQKYLLESMGGGVALFDYNSDGLLDVFLVNGAALEDPMPPGKLPDKADPKFWNRLYRNNGDGSFTDVTKQSAVAGHSYGMGVAVGDYDNDGYPDLYVTNFGENILYHNEGNGTFVDVTNKARVAGGGWSAGAGFVDYDRDGLLDLVVARYLDWDFSRNIHCGENKPGYRSYCSPDVFPPVSHLVYHNNGNGIFADVSQDCRVASFRGKGLGVAFNDFNLDGWPDLFVANDSFPQQLFQNSKDGTFKEVGLASGVAYDNDGRVFAGMGLAFQDYNNDGWPDVFVNALANQGYALFQNSRGSFDYVAGSTGLRGITMLHSGWGADFIDYDDDGWKDLFVAQGHVMDNIELIKPNLRYLEPASMIRNEKGKFQDVSSQSGSVFRIPRPMRGAAFGDINNDGHIDVVINCNDAPAVVLRNESGNQNHWLLVNTKGVVSNRDGIGSRIRLVTQSGMEQFAFVSTAASYLSASDKRVHFGLGGDKIVRLLEITWPSGRIQRMEDIPADQILNVNEPDQAGSKAAN
jgi:enediyne biosynthesis protein E4